MVELVFVPVILSEELVECAFPACWEDFSCNPFAGPAAGGSKTCDIGLRVVSLMIRQRLELVEEFGTGQEVRDRQHQPLTTSTSWPYLNVRS